MKHGVNQKIVKSTLFLKKEAKRVLTDVSAMLPSSGRLSVYQDATRACIKVPYNTKRPFFSFGDGSTKSLEIRAIQEKLLTFRVCQSLRMRIENGDLQKSWRQSYERVRAGTNGEAKNFAKDTTSFRTASLLKSCYSKWLQLTFTSLFFVMLCKFVFSVT